MGEILLVKILLIFSANNPYLYSLVFFLHAILLSFPSLGFFVSLYNFLLRPYHLFLFFCLYISLLQGHAQQCSRATPKSILRKHSRRCLKGQIGCQGSSQVSHVQGVHLTCFIISLVPLIFMLFFSCYINSTGVTNFLCDLLLLLLQLFLWWWWWWYFWVGGAHKDLLLALDSGSLLACLRDHTEFWD